MSVDVAQLAWLCARLDDDDVWHSGGLILYENYDSWLMLWRYMFPPRQEFKSKRFVVDGEGKDLGKMTISGKNESTYAIYILWEKDLWRHHY